MPESILEDKREEWSEDRIYFFVSDGQAVNFRQPYLDSPFDGGPSPTGTQGKGEGAAGANVVFHRNVGILRLGILLIEVHTWKPIERFRDGGDVGEDGRATANADFTTALRVLDLELGDCHPTYKSAVRACLDVDWVPAGSRVSLEDETTCGGLYKNVIVPIREEIEWGEKAATKYGARLTV